MRRHSQYTIGCDPEFFLTNEQGDFVSAHGIVQGTKYNPTKVDKGAIQVDGTALEFNIDPVTTLKDFMGNINVVLDELHRRVQEAAPGLKFTFVPMAKYKPEVFDQIPIDALILGCDPDFNAYTGSMNDRPEIKGPIRTASGHIHVGWTDNEKATDPSHFYDCMAVTKQLDQALYIPSLLFDKDEERRQYYGARGAFRPKSYGVEYRVLSNKWLTDLRLRAWVFRATKKAMNLLDDDIELINLMDKDWNPLQSHTYLVEKFGFPALPKDYLNGTS